MKNAEYPRCSDGEVCDARARCLARLAVGQECPVQTGSCLVPENVASGGTSIKWTYKPMYPRRLEEGRIPVLGDPDAVVYRGETPNPGVDQVTKDVIRFVKRYSVKERIEMARERLGKESGGHDDSDCVQ